MSSEAVAIPYGLVALPLAGAALAVAAVVVPGTMAAKKIKALIDGNVEKVRYEIEKERERQNEWFAAVERQRVEMATALERALDASRFMERLAQIELRAPAARVTRQARREKGILDDASPAADTETAALLREALAEVSRRIGEAEEQLSGAKDFPARLLHGHVQRLIRRCDDGQAVSESEVEDCRQLAVRTIGDWQAQAERAATRRMEAAGKGARLHAIAVERSRLVGDAAIRSELDSLARTLQDDLASGKLHPARVSDLDGILQPLLERADASVCEAAARAELRRSVVEHLTGMGYELIEDFPAEAPLGAGRAMLRMPRGEVLTVVLQANGRLEFELSHADVAGVDEDVAEFLPTFREQEVQWCEDLKKLFERLRKHGFNYKINIERLKRDEAIRVIHLETAETWSDNQTAKKPAWRARPHQARRKQP